LWCNRDIKHAYDYGIESYETADRLATFIYLQELKKALTDLLPEPIMPEAMTSKTPIQSKDSLTKTVLLSPNEPSQVAHVGNSLDPK
jgi:hypothetical protein